MNWDLNCSEMGRGQQQLIFEATDTKTAYLELRLKNV